MRVLTLTLPGLSAMLTLGCGAPEPGPAPEPTPDSSEVRPGFAPVGVTPCEPVGEVQFVCDLVSPEDLVVVPGEEWVIASGLREGGRLQARQRARQDRHGRVPDGRTKRAARRHDIPDVSRSARRGAAGGIHFPRPLPPTGSRRRPHVVCRPPRLQGGDRGVRGGRRGSATGLHMGRMRASAVDYSNQWCGRSAWGRRSGHKWGDRKRVGVARRCGVDSRYRVPTTRRQMDWRSRGTGAGCTLPGGARRSSRACRLIRRRCRLTSSSWDSGLTIYGCRSTGRRYSQRVTPTRTDSRLSSRESRC